MGFLAVPRPEAVCCGKSRGRARKDGGGGGDEGSGGIG